MQAQATTGLRMLIVDDDDAFRDRLVRALEERHFQVSAARDYESALEEARRQPPAWALVDLRMPGRSGLELVRDLCALVPSVRVVVLTGYGSIASAVDAVKLGAVNYLTKPADADDVVAAFARAPAAPRSAPEPDWAVPTLARTEWEHISRVLADCGGNISQAARKLGIPRRSLQLKLKKYPPRQ